MKESKWCIKLLKFINKYPLVKDLKSFITNLNLFVVQDLSLRGLSYIEIPKKRNSQYKWRVIVNQELWKELEGSFNSFNFRQETDFQAFVFCQVANSKYAILKIPASSSHIGFIIIPMNDEMGEFTTFFGQMASLVEGKLLNFKEWGEFNDYKELIFKDDVTSLFNQRKLDLDLEECIRRHDMNEENFFIFFVDIDRFKQVNDGHGHLVGTALLGQVGNIIKEQFRESDYVYRYGGDEFVVIVRDVDQKQANIIGERLLEKIKSTPFMAYDDIDDQEHEFEISVSIGIAGYPFDASSKREILSIADKMMYEAKSTGRGKVCQASEIFKSIKNQSKSS